MQNHNQILANRIQQNINRINHHDKVGSVPGIQDYFCIRKPNNIIHYISKLKEKNHTILSTDEDKSCDKIQHPFMIKIFGQ